MNRRKKVVQILNSRAKKSKSTQKNKPKYISKADRAKLAEEANQDSTITSEDTSPTESS